VKLRSEIFLIVAAFFVAFAVKADAAEGLPEKYQKIIERKPFGRSVDANAGVAVSESSVFSRYAFVGLVGSPNIPPGLQAVIFDTDTKECHFKVAGDTLNNVVVVRIDGAQPTPKLTLQHSDGSADLFLGEGMPASAAATTTAPAASKRRETAAPSMLDLPTTAPHSNKQVLPDGTVIRTTGRAVP